MSSGVRLCRAALCWFCCAVRPCPPPSAALVVWLCPASCRALTCPAVCLVLCCAAPVLLRLPARFSLCCWRCLVPGCAVVCYAGLFGAPWCGGVAVLCAVVRLGAQVWFAVFFCAVLCSAVLVLWCLAVWCAAVLCCRWLHHFCRCRAVPCWAVLFGAVLRHVWCHRVLLRAVVFCLALCGVMVRCVVWCAAVPCCVVMALPSCPALTPPHCSCPCCLALPCILLSFSASRCACRAVLLCAGAVASCCSFGSVLVPLPGAVVRFCMLFWFFCNSVVRWCCPAVWCGVSWCPGAQCCVLWCCVALRCCAACVCCAFSLLFVVVFFSESLCCFFVTLLCFFIQNLQCLLKLRKIRNNCSRTIHALRKTMAVNLRVAGRSV